MSGATDIFNSKIISAEWDVFWSDASGMLDPMESRPVLVISSAYEAGSRQEEQLKKMLTACKLQPEDYQVLQFGPETKLAWHLMRDKIKPAQVVLLGVAPEQMGLSIHFMPHQLNRFDNISWIVTGTLDELMQNPDIKNHVWNYGLKPVFLDKVYG